jgi:hypothetical protein
VPVAFHDFADESHNWMVWRRNLFSSLPWVSGWFVSTGVTGALEPSGTTAVAVAAAKSGLEPAPTDAALQAPPDDLHAATPAPPAPTGVAAGAAGHRPPSALGRTAQRTRGRGALTVRVRPRRA